MVQISSVAVDARTLTFKETGERGIGTYTTEHLSAWAQLSPHVQFKLLIERDADFVRGHKLLSLPNISKDYFSLSQTEFTGVDLYHVPDPMSMIEGYDSPYRMAPTGIKSSMVFYDLIPLALRHSVYDKWHTNIQRAYKNRLRHVVDSQAAILSISECTKRDLVNLINVPEQRISVIMAGLTKQPNFSPLPQQIAQTKAKFAIDKPFMLVVGGIDEHKGFLHTLEASLALLNSGQLQLVVVGSLIDPWKLQLKEMLERKGVKGVIFTGFIEDSDLTCLYADAIALSFPSEYEGFGFPVLEAMAHGCPVICSSKASLPEVAGNAALLLPTNSSDSIFNAIREMISTPDLRAKLAKLGRERAQIFSWQAVAEKTVSFIAAS